MLDHPDLLLILARQRRDDLARLPRREAAPPTREGTPLRVSLARYLRQLADRLEPRRVGAGQVHA
jgi:hypothetical protein